MSRLYPPPLSLPTRYKSIDLHLLAAALILSAVLAGGAYLARTLVTPLSDASVEETVIVEIGDRSIEVLRRWLVTVPPDVDGGRVTLSLPLAEMVHGEEGDEDARVLLVLNKSDGSLEPSDRPRLIYARFLSSNATSSVGGLVHRPFRAGSPYQGEALYLTPPEGRQFAARCPIEETPGLPVMCFTELRIEGLDIQLQIERRHLALWEPVVAWTRQLVSTGNGRDAAGDATR